MAIFYKCNFDCFQRLSIIVHPNKENRHGKIRIKALLKNGLKLSPEKCKLF